MIRIVVRSDRKAVTVMELNTPKKGFFGSEEETEFNANRWAEQYNVAHIEYESEAWQK